MSENVAAPQLARNQVGLMAALFQSITSMAPGAAIAASVPLGAAFAGGALPLSVVIAFIGILFTAASIGQLAKHIPAAGSVATYSAVGLWPPIGFLVGWAYAAVEVLIVPLVMLQLGYTVAGEWHSESASFPLGAWWVFMLAGTFLMCWLVYRGVRTSTSTGVWLGFVEILVFLALSIVLVVKAGDHNTLPSLPRTTPTPRASWASPACSPARSARCSPSRASRRRRLWPRRPRTRAATSRWR